ncbi:MAG: MFS transporter [Thermomicrobiales bacterium]|nr:MAG: MFS transporter [Thermomicrobiales bacterium]
MPFSNSAATIRLGLRANWQQFWLLVLVNAFVGGMVGLERAVVPLLAEEEFGRTSRTVALSFIVSFGIVKALANLIAGRFSDSIGRKRVLVAGWLFGLPVPFLVIWAPTWEWVVFANVLLGINQGLCWSTTVIMKIDLVGPARRGLAMGLNEAAGYGAVSAAALASGYLAATYSLRPAPFLLGIGFALAGLLLSLMFIRDSHDHVQREATLVDAATEPATAPAFRAVFRTTSWGDRALFGISQAGLVNNLNDGLAWGLLPLFFAAHGASLSEIGWLAALYPGVWGISQLGTGPLSDRVGRKPLIVLGMWVQALGIIVILLGGRFWPWAAGATLLGLGTALVYPTLLAAIGDVAHPLWRASAVGVYRLWRDGGYAAGALVAGALADLLGIRWAIGGVAALTFASGVVAGMAMYETRAANRIVLASPGTLVEGKEVPA